MENQTNEAAFIAWWLPDSSFQVLFHSTTLSASSGLNPASALRPSPNSHIGLLHSCTPPLLSLRLLIRLFFTHKTSTLSQVSPQVPVSSWAPALTSGPTLKPLCRDSSLQSSLLTLCFYFPPSVATKQSFPLTLVITGSSREKMVQKVLFICPCGNWVFFVLYSFTKAVVIPHFSLSQDPSFVFNLCSSYNNIMY